ncbi:PseG/SpsG family protein [Sphingobacterium sp. NPDC055346]
MLIDKIVIRLDAGQRFGLGHLSRCISLVQGFKSENSIFIIKTDSLNLVKTYLKNTLNLPFTLIPLDVEIGLNEEINLLEKHCVENTLLILDHYEATEEYQIEIKKRNISWLQLDSHAKVNFLANWVMHGSPGATTDLYEPLRKCPNTRFLLGPKYCIIKDQLKMQKDKRRLRTNLKNIVICFGGGEDGGATLECLKSLDFQLFSDIEFSVIINPVNSDYEEICLFEKEGLIRIYDQYRLTELMILSDLGLIAPGMMSYESAFLGLPMILISIADNQFINAVSWEKRGCAMNVGGVENISLKINNYINHCKDALYEMSANCLTLVDGRGVERIVNEIKK